VFTGIVQKAITESTMIIIYYTNLRAIFGIKANQGLTPRWKSVHWISRLADIRGIINRYQKTIEHGVAGGGCLGSVKRISREN